MNAKSFDIELLVERVQLEEAVMSIMHTILLHRSMGKFNYKQEKTFSVGTLGTEDIDCDFLDFTYVRVSSKLLDAIVRKQVQAFRDQLQENSNNGVAVGTITLEFYQQKRTGRWNFSNEPVPWERWNVQVTERVLGTEGERSVARETTAVKLADKIISIVESVGRHDFVPKMPEKAELPFVFDTSFPDVQPYLFKIYHSFGSTVGANQTTTVGSAVRRLFGNTTI